MRPATTALVVALFAASGCLTQESLGKDLAEGDAGAEDTTSEGGDETRGADETGDGGGDGTGETDGTDGTDGTMGGEDVCAPEDQDSHCRTCQKEMCCEAWERCRQNDRCICIVVCREEGHSVDACVTHCGADDGESHDLMSCEADRCGDLCP